MATKPLPWDERAKRFLKAELKRDQRMLSESRWRLSGLILGYFFFLEVLSWWTASTPPCIVQDGDYHDAQHNQRCATFVVGLVKIAAEITHIVREFISEAENVTALATVVLAFFPFTLWRSTNKLWQAGEAQRLSSEGMARRQLHSSERIAMQERMQTRSAIRAANRSANAAAETVRVMRRAERPYLTPFAPELRNWGKAIETYNESEVMEVHLDITNIGKSVGFIVGYGIAHEICRDGQQGGVALTVHDGFSRMPLGPDGKLDAGAPFDVFQISAADRLAMIEFDKTLYLYGYVRYCDFFNVFRKTGFMFEFIPVRTEPWKSSFAVCRHAMWNDEEEASEHDRLLLPTTLMG